jgi:hypothetical protein
MEIYQVHQESEFLRQIKKVTIEDNVSQVNRLLKRGWMLLAIEQQNLEYKVTTTSFVLGNVEENAS